MWVTAFMVPAVTSAQHFEAFPEPPTWMFVDHRIDGFDDLGITIMPFGNLIIGRPRESDTTATALYRQMMLAIK